VRELTVRKDLRLGHNHIDTEHILLGLLGVEEGVAARVLTDLGLSKRAAEAWITEELRERS
jgi:ATP-dependent Clp protease ATP-binding subunit ClpA